MLKITRDLFEYFNRKEETVHQDKFFFFNWFDHSSLVPRYPVHRDEISNVFYYEEGYFLIIEFLTLQGSTHFRGERFIDSNIFLSVAPTFKRGYIRRSRFYKRKYDWFLKHHA